MSKPARDNNHLVRINQRFDHDFPFYSKYHLKIRTKAGEIVPFILNKAQWKLHEAVEKQKAETGKVRMLILKARQQGFSTYVGARFYHRTSRFPGKATFILSHEAETTEKLFQIVERFHKNVPSAAQIPTEVANRRRMVFSGINSEYFVGTAGNENVGRGGTIQHLHASEAAFYPPGSGFSKGLLQSVPDMRETEVYLESTANGMDPLFYPMAMMAMKGQGEYRLFFSPWFWQEEYRKEIPEDFMPTKEEEELAALYKLDWQQIYWRRMKIIDFGGNADALKSFMQEYPATVEEAFITSGDSLISSFKVAEARKSTITDPNAPLVIGIDPNEAMGRSGFAMRRGRHLERVWAVTGKKPMELVGYIADLIEKTNPVKVFIDTGNGFGVIDRLIEMGFGDVIIPVSFNDGATEESVYLNKRTEMYHALKHWIELGGVRVPDEDLFHKQVTATPGVKNTSSGLKKLESKDKIMEDKKIDLDEVDAAVLTFAFPVRVAQPSARRVKIATTVTRSKLKSVARREGYTPARSVTVITRM